MRTPKEFVGGGTARRLGGFLVGGILAGYSASYGATASIAKTSFSRAENFTVNSWTSQDGLPGNALWAQALTRDGYLWLAGLNGLARFDGVRFVRFRLWDGLPSLQIQHLLGDCAGRLWIGTEDGGVTVREAGHFRSFSRTNGLGGDRVRALAEDAEGRIWVAHEKGLARWEVDRFVDVTPEKAVGCSSVFCGATSVWAVSDDRLIHEWRAGKWQSVPSLEKTDFRFDRVFQTRDGALWGHLHPFGLARLEAGQWRVFDEQSGLPKSYIHCVLDQGEAGLLCGTYDQGLFRFKDNRATEAGLNRPPEIDGVLSLQEDKLGNLWVGTKARGLQRLRHARLQTVPGSDRVRIARIASDTRGRFWIGGGEEIWFEKEGQLVPVPTPPGVQKFTVATLKPCAAGGVWISVSGKGLWQYDPDRHDTPIQKLRAGKGESSGVLLAEDTRGGFWFGTESGTIGRLTDKATNLFTVSERPANKKVIGLFDDASGGIWVRIEGIGFIRYDALGKVLNRLGPGDGVPVNSIRCWLGDREGALWFGTPTGLYCWKNSRVTSFDSRHGLPEEVVANLVEDLSGNLWCVANNWLFRLQKKELEQVAAHQASVVHPLVIGRSSGLKPVPFAAGIASRAIRASNGRLFFPRIWDVVSFDPADFEQPEPAPRVVIEEVSADGRRVDFSGPTHQPLQFPAGTEEIVLRYTALECAAPETLQFRYRLDDVDKSWSEAGDQRVVNFRRLPPGMYRFRVTASAAGSPWAEPGATIQWEIAPFFWQTAWFRSLAVLLGVGALGSLAWRRVRTLEKRRVAQEMFSRRLLESQETERRRIAAELHDSLGQELVLVKNLATLVQRNGNAAHLSEISAASSRALDEVRAISYALRPPELDRLGLEKALKSMVRRAETASGIQFSQQLELAGSLPEGMDIQLFRIAQEAVNNIVKYSQAKTARVEMWRDNSGLHLVVADDGRGLSDSRDGEASSMGLGMAAIEERVRLLTGRLEWISKPGRGTTLSVLVPLETMPVTSELPAKT